MSLRSQFQTNPDLVRDGAWSDVCTNSDGTKCRVKLRRSGRGNPLWAASFREHSKDVDTEKLSPYEDAAIMGNVMAEASVADWEHMQPDDDGKELACTVENAKALLTDPKWIDLLTDWQTRAGSVSTYQKLEAEAKN